MVSVTTTQLCSGPEPAIGKTSINGYGNGPIRMNLQKKKATDRIWPQGLWFAPFILTESSTEE